MEDLRFLQHGQNACQLGGSVLDCLFVCLFVCWLVGWLVGWLAGWLAGWFISRPENKQQQHHLTERKLTSGPKADEIHQGAPICSGSDKSHDLFVCAPSRTR